ncbi:MAG: hypothetical protein H0X36_07655, partial [Sphingomonadaceae bacterium]|nr:hypothetical protein [Sphingomonadaceae bacterium]
MEKFGKWSALLAGGALAITLASPAGASGGGGGGADFGGAPSQSAPQYDPAAEYRAGISALGANRFIDAKRNFDHVLAAAPRDANANYLAGLARSGLKDNKGALHFYEKAVKYDDSLIQAHKQYGVALAATGQRDRARAELDALKARSAQCGASCAQAADLNDAIAAITTALGAAPQAMIDAAPGLLFASSVHGDQAYLEAVGLINEHRYEAAIESLTR